MSRICRFPYIFLVCQLVISRYQVFAWKGNAYNPEVEFDPLNYTRPDEIPLPASSGWIETISWSPRAFIYHNFITDMEAKHLIKLASISMKRSTVVGQGGKSVEDSYRTSYGTFLKRYRDTVLKRIENRVAVWTRLPVENQEDVQILRYGIGQFYKLHQDTIRDPVAGIRIATILIYLNEPEEGGETAFPMSKNWVHNELPEKYGPFSKCAEGVVAFKPKRGDALLFWDLDPDGMTEDMTASHTGCPVVSGVKWTATVWVHQRPFREEELSETQLIVPDIIEDPGICEDYEKSCIEWARAGQCESNTEFMVQSASSLGRCRKACNACQVCDDSDTQCYNKNRVDAGYLLFNPDELN